MYNKTSWEGDNHRSLRVSPSDYHLPGYKLNFTKLDKFLMKKFELQVQDKKNTDTHRSRHKTNRHTTQEGNSKSWVT